MNTKGIKFLTVLAVLAMAFASIAVLVAADDSDASTSTQNPTTTPIDSSLSIVVPGGQSDDCNVVNTVVYDKSSSTVTIEGIVGTGCDLTGNYSSKSVYVANEWAIIYLKGFDYQTNKYYNITQYNSALKVFYGVTGETIEKAGNSYKKVTAFEAIQYQSTPAVTANSVFAFLMPKDGSSITLEIRNGASAAAAVTADPYTITIDCSKVSTQVTVGSVSANVEPTGESGWKIIDSSNEDYLLLDGYTGTTVFKFTDASNNNRIMVNGTNKITSNALAQGSAMLVTGGTLTISNAYNASSGKANADSLTINLAAGSYGIQFSVRNTVTITESKTTYGDFTLSISGGNRAIDTNCINFTGGVTADVSATEVAIRARSTGTTAALSVDTSTLKASIEEPTADNARGVNSPFAIRADYNVVVNEGATIIAQGLELGSAAAITHTSSKGIVYVTGGYTQPDFATYKGVAGLYNGNSSAFSATYISSASSGSEGTTYVVGDADTYNVTVTGAVQSKTVTPTAQASVTALISKIKEEATNQKNLTVDLKNQSTAMTLDLSDLMKEGTVSNLTTLTLIGDSDVTITSTADVDVSNTAIKIINGTGTFTGSMKSGSNSAIFQSVGGTFGVSSGSIDIEGEVVGGTIYVKGDVKLAGFVDSTSSTTIRAQEDSVATIDVNKSFYFKKGTINFIDVGVQFNANLLMIQSSTNTIAMNFGEGAYLLSDLSVVGSNNAYCSVSFTEAQTKSISLSNVAISGAIETSKDLTISSGTVTAADKITVGGDLNVAFGATFNVNSGATAKTIAITGGANVAGTLGLTKTKLTIAGSSTVSGLITYADADSVITNNGTMTVATAGVIGGVGTTSIGAGNVVNKSVMVIKGEVIDLTNEKTVRLYGIIGYSNNGGTTNVGKLVNNGTIVVMDTAAQIYISTENKSGTGTIDISGVSENVTISGNIVTAETNFNKFQIVTLTADTYVKKGANISFAGNVVIPEGIKLTIESGAFMQMSGAFAKLTNDGIIEVEGIKATHGAMKIGGGEVVNNNSIIAAYDGTGTDPTITIASGVIFNNNGYFEVGENSKVTTETAYFINAATGSISVIGDLYGAAADGTAIVNKGTVNVNSEKNTALFISNAASGAIVNVVSTVAGMTIQDMQFKTADIATGANKIQIAKGGELAPTDAVGGFVVKETTFKDPNNSSKVTQKMVVNGIVGIDSDLELSTAGNKSATFTVTKYVDVDDSLTIDEGVKFTMAATAFMTVSGILTIDGDAANVINAGAKMVVTGTVYAVKNALADNLALNAAYYTVPKTTETEKYFVYTTFENAISQATEDLITPVSVKGDVAVSSKVTGTTAVKTTTIPAGMTVKILSGTFNVGSEAVITVSYEDLVAAKIDLAAGAMIKVGGKLVFDNMSKGFKGTDSDITSEVILKSGDSVTYTTLAWAMIDVGTEEATLTLCGATTISKNTTIPENITVDTNGNDFTVSDAELTIDGALFLNGGTYTVTGDNAKIVVNGAITKESKMDYTDGKAYPAGLYFHMNDSALYVIGSIADAETWAVLADDNSMTYKGVLKTSSIDFDVAGTLVFEGTVEAKAMDIGSKAKVTFSKSVSIDTVTMGDSTITIKDDAYLDGTFVSSVGSISFNKAVASADSTITVATANDVTTMTLAGAIEYVLQLDSYQVATLGNVTVKADLFELSVGLGTTTIGKNSNIDYLEVYGDLVVDNGFKLTSDAAAIYGTLTANAATDTKAKATAEIDELYVGIAFDTSAVSAVYGDVTADVALVGAGSTVPEAISGMNYSTDVYVETAEVLTAYASSAYVSIFYYLADVDFDISDPNAKGPVWYDEDGDKVLTTATIGDYEAIYAVYDYNVYSVTIVTDAGIKSVAIGGIELVNIGGNVFSLGTAEDPLTPLTAGTYKVTYTLKSGYEGTAVLSTETGTILKDNSFTIMPGNESKALNFQLAGTEPTPEPEPEPTPTPEEKSEWTVTTILLCVLVVLIAIMAVIVALRLNRN